MTRHSLIVLMLALSPLTLAQADSLKADKFIKFVKEADADASSDCNQRGGLRVFIINEHPDQIVDIQLDRYFAEVRQPGRSMFALENGHKLPLGCDIVMDSPQRWELLDAEFISRNQAEARYGMIY